MILFFMGLLGYKFRRRTDGASRCLLAIREVYVLPDTDAHCSPPRGGRGLHTEEL